MVSNSAAAPARVSRSSASSTSVASSAERVWAEITDVDIANYANPRVFRLMGIPHPLRAEVLADGVGGQRIAYFATGKRFVQRITTWEPLREYAFTFNPEKGFRVAFFFDLSDGVIQLVSGAYLLDSDNLDRENNTTRIRLSTSYSIDRRAYLLLDPPVRVVLQMFQRYLLRSIKRNVQRHDRA